MNIPSIVRCVLVAAASLVLCAGARAAGTGANTGEPRDLWYVVELAGKRAGYMRTTESMRDGHVITTSDTTLTIKRGNDANNTITINFTSEFEETPDGKPVRSVTTQSLGAAPVTTTIRFLPDKVEQTVKAADGNEAVTTSPLPEGVWLTPAAAGEYVRKRLEADAKEIVVRTLEPSMGLTPIVTTYKVLEKTTAEALGRTVPAYKVSSVVDRMPGVTSDGFVDLEGNPIRTTMNVGGLPMTMIAADKDLALSKVDAPELMKSTLVKPDRAIPDPRHLRRAVFLLSVDDGGDLGTIVSGAAQTAVIARPRDQVRVTVDLDANPVARVSPADQERALASSTLVTSNDQQVKDLVAKIDRAANPTPAARAEAMRKFVFNYIRKKNLGVGFASAADVARTKEGDCSEHAVLLAAMLRADGTPSRVVSGLVYVDEFLGSAGVFGYHMWTQGLFTEASGQQHWVDLDATLGQIAPFDATHIALVHSYLEDDGAMNSMVSLAGMLGRLKVKVEEIGAAPAGGAKGER